MWLSFGAFYPDILFYSPERKNMLGHLAYILEGATSLTSIKPQHLKIEANGMPYEDDYIFQSHKQFHIPCRDTDSGSPVCGYERWIV